MLRWEAVRELSRPKCHCNLPSEPVSQEGYDGGLIVQLVRCAKASEALGDVSSRPLRRVVP